MSKELENKAIVGRWFTEFWGNPWNPKVIDELASPDMLLQYSLHAPRRGREDVRDFITGFRKAFPDLGFGGAADLIAEGDYVVGRWEGGGTHTGPAFSDFLTGSLQEIQQVAGMFGMNFWSDDGYLTHSLHTVILGRKGQLAANLEGNQFTAEELGDLVQTVMKE